MGHMHDERRGGLGAPLPVNEARLAQRKLLRTIV
jgi:hypothetical protein